MQGAQPEERKADEVAKQTLISPGPLVVDTKKKITQGSTSRIYQKGTDRAVKVVEKTFKRPFNQEQKVLYAIEGLGVAPQVFTIDKDALAIEMQLGEADLKNFTVKRSKKKENRHIDEQELKKILRQLFTFIKAMDSVGVYHCDIQPGNVLVMKESDMTIRLIDFALGVCDVFQHPRLTKSNGEAFQDVKKQFENTRLQVLQFEIDSVFKTAKEIISTCIYRNNTEAAIRQCKYGDPTYWKVFELYYRDLMSFFQKYTDQVIASLTEEGILQLYKEIGVA